VAGLEEVEDGVKDRSVLDGVVLERESADEEG